MVTTVSGKHMDVGAALQEHVRDRINLGVRKYLHDVTQAKIVFSKNAYLYHADIIIHDSHMGIVKAESESEDVYAAFDTAIIKIEKQLRKHKGKIRKHVKGIKEGLIEDAGVSGVKYVLNVPHATGHEEQDHEPITIAEKVTNIERLTVGEAIMRMDLAHLPALMFVNKLNHRINMVYHRVDGNISWVDPNQS